MSRTSQRQAVQAALEALDHPTADGVFMRLREGEERVSIGTVYRNLDRLVADGRLRVRQIGGQRRYDTNTEPHAHLHCTRCDRLMDVPWDRSEASALRAEAQRHGFRIEDHLLEAQGVCQPCQKATQQDQQRM